MMHFNKFIGIGSIVKKPQIKESVNGKYAEFNIVFNSVYKKGDNYQEVSTYIKAHVWDENKAKYVVEKFNVGDVVLVEGELRQIRWEDKKGNKKEMICIRCEKIKPILLKDKKEKESKKNEDVISFDEI